MFTCESICERFVLHACGQEAFVIKVWCVETDRKLFPCFCFAKMAGLAKAMAAIQQMEAKATSNKKNFRLIADPCISVESLKRPLRNYLEFHKSSDMWSLVCPPPGGPLTFTWHTPPNGSWLSKCIGLLYDLLEVAPNSKLQSVKLLRALKSLVEDKTMSICTRKMTESDVLDRIDLSIRLLLSHLRQLKQNLSLKLKVLRMCTDDEKMKLVV